MRKIVIDRGAEECYAGIKENAPLIRQSGGNKGCWTIYTGAASPIRASMSIGKPDVTKTKGAGEIT
jgi:hypothetical protein